MKTKKFWVFRNQAAEGQEGRVLGLYKEYDSIVHFLSAHAPIQADFYYIIRNIVALKIGNGNNSNLVGSSVVEGDKRGLKLVNLRLGEDFGKIIHQPLRLRPWRNGSNGGEGNRRRKYYCKSPESH